MAGLTFRERMTGPFVLGVSEPGPAAERGRRTRWTMTVHAVVTIPDIDAFVQNRRADLSGEVKLPGVPRPVQFTGGVFELFPPDGAALMRYEVPLTSAFGEQGPFRLAGVKCSRDKPTLRRIWSDTTRLAVRLHHEPSGELVGAGELRIGFSDLVKALLSMRAPARAIAAYAGLFARKLGQAYLPLRS